MVYSIVFDSYDYKLISPFASDCNPKYSISGKESDGSNPLPDRLWFNHWGNKKGRSKTPYAWRNIMGNNFSNNFGSCDDLENRIAI